MTSTSLSSDSDMLRKTVRCKLDEPIGMGPYNFSLGDEVVVAGWAFLEPPAQAMPSISLESVSRQTGAITRLNAGRYPRPDVATHFGDDKLLMCGFTSRFRIDERFRGEYTVRLRQIESSDVYPYSNLFSFIVAPTASEANVRRELAARFLRGAGLEVGALQRRLEVPDDCSVMYVDRLVLPDLLAHYPELRGQPLQEPDLIDDGETLAKVQSGTQDFVIANHFLEHCENPIQTLSNFMRVLKGGGILYMAVPDKRFTFDIDRRVTAYSDLASTYREGGRRDRAHLYYEWAAYVNRATPTEVAAVATRLLAEGYSIHFNVWRLSDLLEFVANSKRDFELPFDLEWVVCSENEVIMILRKDENGPAE